MGEKFNQYRDELAESIKSLPKEERKMALDAAQSTKEYEDAKLNRDYEKGREKAAALLQGFLKDGENFAFKRYTPGTTHSDEGGSPELPASSAALDDFARYYDTTLKKIFTSQLTPEASNAYAKLQELSAKKIFIDLGCGRMWSDGSRAMIDMTGVLGGKMYVGADRYHVRPLVTDGKNKYCRTHIKERPPELVTPAAYIRQDMLQVIKKFKDDSGVVIMNGVEFGLATPGHVHGRREAADKYRKELNTEIARVIGKDGFIIANDISDMLDFHSADSMFRVDPELSALFSQSGVVNEYVFRVRQNNSDTINKDASSS